MLRPQRLTKDIGVLWPIPDIAAIADRWVRSHPHGAEWSLQLVFYTDRPVSSTSCASPRQSYKPCVSALNVIVNGYPPE